MPHSISHTTAITALDSPYQNPYSTSYVWSCIVVINASVTLTLSYASRYCQSG
jgi:hypothetical protein